MENIIAAEILCTKLQESEKPLEIGIGMALRVVLDENIILEERYQEEKSKIGKQNVSIISKMATISALETENNKLKQANTILTVEIEQANKIVDFYKAFTSGKYRVLQISNVSQLQDFVSSEVQDFLKVQRKGLGKSGKTAALKPQQTSIQFPANIPTVNISEEEKQKSIYYKSAVRRAKKIWDKLKKDPVVATFNKDILNWNTTFNLAPWEPISYTHVEAACMPKCYGGLGIAVGMKLEKFVYQNV